MNKTVIFQVVYCVLILYIMNQNFSCLLPHSIIIFKNLCTEGIIDYETGSERCRGFLEIAQQCDGEGQPPRLWILKSSMFIAQESLIQTNCHHDLQRIRSSIDLSSFLEVSAGCVSKRLDTDTEMWVQEQSHFIDYGNCIA
jgi:hypothetical protein